MRRRGNKVLIILVTVISIFVITGGVFAYIYFYTDILKSGQELFAKYLIQNLEELNETISLNEVNEIEEKLKQSKYEENMTISYAKVDRTEIKSQITIDTQKDPINKKAYGILSLIAEGLENSLEVEYMKEDNMYSLRFTDAVKEFVTVENSNLKQLAMNLGLDEEMVERVPDTIDFEKFSLEKIKFTDDEINTEINKYSQLIYNNIPKEKYQKNKDTVITVNGKTITTNAYRLILNNQDLKNLELKLLETLKQDEIILKKLEKIDEILNEYELDSIKENFVESIQKMRDSINKEETIEDKNIVITVYEENKKTVRIKLEEGNEYITVDTSEQEDKRQIDINYTNIDEENMQVSSKITFTKENDNKLVMQFNNVVGEERNSFNISAELIENENNTQINVVIDIEDNQITFTRNINIVDEINFDVTLNNTNSIILNNLSSERLSYIFNLLSGRLNTEYAEQLKKIILIPDTMFDIINEESNSLENTQDNSMDIQDEMFNSELEL